jgi:hypothetical protein
MEWALLEAILEGRPVDQFHDGVVRPDVEQRADIRMVQCRNHASLALEPFRELRRGNFDGDTAAEARILRAINLTHSTHAETILNCVRSPLETAISSYSLSRTFVLETSKQL